jgi:hypothetical protein
MKKLPAQGGSGVSPLLKRRDGASTFVARPAAEETRTQGWSVSLPVGSGQAMSTRSGTVVPRARSTGWNRRSARVFGLEADDLVLPADDSRLACETRTNLIEQALASSRRGGRAGSLSSCTRSLPDPSGGYS